MPKDRYDFEKEFNIDTDLSKLNTHTYDDFLLSNKADERISARREARKAKYSKQADKKIITEEEIHKAKKKERKKLNARRVFFVGAAFVGVIALAVVSGIKLTSLELEKWQTEKELARLSEEVEQLEAELKELDTDEYVENAARSELHMIKEGEVMYIVDPGSGDAAADQEDLE